MHVQGVRDHLLTPLVLEYSVRGWSNDDIFEIFFPTPKPSFYIIYS